MRIRASKTFGQTVLQLVLITCTFLWSYPFFWMISSAFKSQGEMFLGGLRLIPQEPTLANFTRAWESAKFYLYFFNTVFVTVAVILVVLLVSSLAGYALGRGSMPGKKIILAALVVAMFLPKGFTIIPLFELIVKLGFNNSLMGVVLAEAGPSNVVSILLFMGYFASIPKEVEESAVMDGASQPRIFWSVMLPLTKPIIATVSIFTFIAAWNAFLVPLIFTLGKPDLRTLGVGMYNFFGTNTVDWTGIAAGACMSLIPIIIVFLYLQKYFIEGVAGAIKG